MSGTINVSPASLYGYAGAIRNSASFEMAVYAIDSRQTLSCLQTLQQLTIRYNDCLNAITGSAEQEALMLERIARDLKMADHVAALRMEGGFGDAGP